MAQHDRVDGVLSGELGIAGTAFDVGVVVIAVLAEDVAARMLRAQTGKHRLHAVG